MTTRPAPSPTSRQTLLTRGLLLACIGLLTAALPGCGGRDADAPHKPRVVCTVGMVADLARHIAGDTADVEGLIGTGVDPHLYQATRHDQKALLEADLVFYSGLLLEGRMQDILEKIGKQKTVVAVTDGLKDDPDFLAHGEDDHYDPHVWMDPNAWQHAVTAIETTLAEKMPEHAEAYRTRAQALQDQLTQLDTYAKQAIGSIPEDQRVLVTAHDAFGYLGRAYGLNVQGIQGLSTESEAGLRRINGLVQYIVDHQIPAVFVESSVPTKAVEAVIEGCKSHGHHVVIGGELFSDAMGPTGTYEGTYVGMIDHNLTTIARALGGQAPQRGMQGKLTPHQ